MIIFGIEQASKREGKNIQLNGIFFGFPYKPDDLKLIFNLLLFFFYLKKHLSTLFFEYFAKIWRDHQYLDFHQSEAKFVLRWLKHYIQFSIHVNILKVG